MKKTLIYLIPTLAWAYVFAGFGYAQTYDTLWTKTIGGIYDDGGYRILESFNGDYIITGFTSSYGAGHQDLYLIKTNSNGDTLWTNTFGRLATDFGHSIVEIENGDIMVLGFTGSFGLGGDFYLVKTDSMGDSIWAKNYGGPDMEYGYSIAHADSGFVLLGLTESYGAGNNDIYLIKINNDGDTLWTKTYGGALDDAGFSIQPTFDGGYIITGYTESFGSGLWDVYLVKIDTTGDTLWTSTIGGSGNDYGWYVHQTSANEYMIVGVTDSSGTEDYDIYIVKTDSIGNILWVRTFGGNGFDIGNSICETPEGEYLIAGILNFAGAGSSDVYLIKINNNGDSLWAMTLGGSGSDAAHSIRRTMDDNYVITGYTSSMGAGGFDVYLIKLISDQSDIRNVEYKPCFNIGNNYPNPFNSQTQIRLQLSNLHPIEIGLHDLLGRKVRSIYSGVPQGYDLDITIDLSSEKYSSGIYFIVAEQGGERRVIKSTLLK